MSADRENTAERIDEELETILEKKLPKPPKSIRKQIRRLKASDERERADTIAQEHRQRKIPLRKYLIAKIKLFETIDEIFANDDVTRQAKNQVRAVWLMQASGIITNEERINNLREIIEATEDVGLNSEIEDIFVKTRDQLQKYLPNT